MDAPHGPCVLEAQIDRQDFACDHLHIALKQVVSLIIVVAGVVLVLGSFGALVQALRPALARSICKQLGNRFVNFGLDGYLITT